MGGVFAVDLGHGVELALNLLLVEGVKVDSDVLLAVKGHSGGLASDGGGVDLNTYITYKYTRSTNYWA